MEEPDRISVCRPTDFCNLVGVEPPLRPSHVWSIRTKLQIAAKQRDLALFNLGIEVGYAIEIAEKIDI
jgi:hypothetical protein